MERSLPAAITDEAQVLGALMLEPDAILAVVEWLHPNHFYLEKHAWIYEAIRWCFHQRIPPDFVTVSSRLTAQQRLDLIGGHGFLLDLVANVATAVHVEYYAHAVETAAAERELIRLGGKVTALGYTTERPLEERIGDVNALLYQFNLSRTKSTAFQSLSSIADEAYEAAKDVDPDSDLAGLTTTFPDLDAMTSGVMVGVNIIAARPRVGKTSFALSMAYAYAMAGIGVGIFSLEMDRKSLLYRLIAMHTNMIANHVPRRIARGDATAVEALGVLSDLPISIDDTGGLDVHQIRTRVLQLMAVRPLGVLFVDYLQLIGGHGENENARISAISRGLMGLAKELQIPIFVLSQLNREIEKRSNRTPSLSDLRDSGAIEQDARQVWALDRPELYAPEDSSLAGKAVVHVLKNRDGATGMVSLQFNAPTTAFRSLERYRAVEGY